MILEAKELHKEYKNGKTIVKAVEDVSFAIKRGSFNAIIGRSGCGKSTLLHMLGGLLTPTSGEVILEDNNLYQLKENRLTTLRRRRIGMIYQDYNLLPEFTVMDNILIPSYLDYVEPDKGYVDELLSFLKLEDKIHNFPDELSGGQQQRVAIARALSTKPAVLLADEPTGDLDAMSSEEVLAVLKSSQIKFGQTIIMVTHDLGMARCTDRIITMEDGKVASDVGGCS